MSPRFGPKRFLPFLFSHIDITEHHTSGQTQHEKKQKKSKPKHPSAKRSFAAYGNFALLIHHLFHFDSSLPQSPKPRNQSGASDSFIMKLIDLEFRY